MVQRRKRVAFWLVVGAALLAAAAICFCLVVSLVFPIKYSDLVEKEAKNFNIEPQLIYAVIWTESKFKPDAVSSADARGLMQLLSSTAIFCAQKLGEEYSEEKLLDPAFNIRLGAFYLSYLFNRFNECGADTAIAAYNAGEGNVTKWLNEGGEIKFKETRDYIKRVRLAKYVYKLKSC